MLLISDTQPELSKRSHLSAFLLTEQQRLHRLMLLNALGMSGSDDTLTINKFEKGSRALEYYSYNYAVPPMKSDEMQFYFV